jgi:putative Ca2+/H+ antiporter (TMEM165/GDT1 family)
MDWRIFATVFATIFIAELGDKTQVATLLYAADGARPKWTIFFAAAAALVLTSAIGVLAGATLSRYLRPDLIRWLAGAGFIAVGVWILLARDG